MHAGPFLERCQPDCDIVRAGSVGEGLALLRTEQFDGVYANPQDPAIWERAGSLLQADYILDVLGDGIALVHPDLRITWANTSFEKWCGGPVKGRTFYEALGSPNILGPDYCPFHTALAGKPVTTRLHCRDNLYVELSVTPVCDTTGKVSAADQPGPRCDGTGSTTAKTRRPAQSRPRIGRAVRGATCRHERRGPHRASQAQHPPFHPRSAPLRRRRNPPCSSAKRGNWSRYWKKG